MFVRAPRDLPPTYGNLLRMGDSFTYAAHRTLLPGQSLVREYTRGDITSFPATGTTDPGDRDDAMAGAIENCEAARSTSGVCRSKGPSHGRARSR